MHRDLLPLWAVAWLLMWIPGGLPALVASELSVSGAGPVDAPDGPVSAWPRQKGRSGFSATWAPSWAGWSASGEEWTWQALPEGIIYRSYLAGVKEPRFASQFVYQMDHGWVWDAALGGRVGLIRYGNRDPLRPEGWQVDFEGGVLPRLDLEQDRDVISMDFRAGVPFTYGMGPWRWKFAYYHLCSHLGDEYLLRYPDTLRLNYVRDALVLGASYYPNEDLRLYAEAAWSFYAGDRAEPWEFQFGIDYSPLEPIGFGGAPFFAINGHLREEVDFGGNLVVQTGWQWRGTTGHLFRAGLHYYVGKSDQYEFYDNHEEKIGLAIWYDF